MHGLDYGGASCHVVPPALQQPGIISCILVCTLHVDAYCRWVAPGIRKVTHTYTHIHIYMHIHICVCVPVHVCVCVYFMVSHADLSVFMSDSISWYTLTQNRKAGQRRIPYMLHMVDWS